MNDAFATTDPAEREFLSLILQSFDERDRYEVYADWLLERGQLPAGDFVRSLARHSFGGVGEAPVPDPVGTRSAAWHRLLGVRGSGASRTSWHEALRACEAPQRAALMEWLRPVVGLEPTLVGEGSLALGASRFLGAPDLPVDFVWPECASGPLRFQAQIDLRDLRHSLATARFGLPVEGWLLLFAYDDDGEEGIQPGVGAWTDEAFGPIEGLTHVAYLPPSAELVRRAIPPRTRMWDGSDYTCRLSFTEWLDVPLVGDVEDPRYEGDELEELVWDLRGDWEHKLMGYPVHARTHNTSPGAAWLNLLTLGSGEPTPWSWSDGEHLDVYVPEAAVRSGSFTPCFGYAA